MGENINIFNYYDIQYTKAAEKFFKVRESVRDQYESAIKERLVGEHPERVDVARIKGKRNDYYRIRVGDYRFVIYTDKWKNSRGEYDPCGGAR